MIPPSGLVSVANAARMLAIASRSFAYAKQVPNTNAVYKPVSIPIDVTTGSKETLANPVAITPKALLVTRPTRRPSRMLATAHESAPMIELEMGMENPTRLHAASNMQYRNVVDPYT
jgi:hypothetical protein